MNKNEWISNSLVSGTICILPNYGGNQRASVYTGYSSNSYNIKNQNRWKYLFVNYLFTSHQKQYIKKKKNSKKIEKSGSTLYFCTFVMSGLNEND